MGKEGQCRVRRQLDTESREEDERDGRRFCMRMGDGDVKGISPKKIPHTPIPSHPFLMFISSVPQLSISRTTNARRHLLSKRNEMEKEKKFCPLFFRGLVKSRRFPPVGNRESV